ncbi:unnamed protein product [Meganyctiphanes norvegica]|uniref:PX domain-containing protein n=1 Tax=Meganyctiphanes norvegica TaxID=48144 RepID=A0AAV2S8G0_MEGNR
MIRTYIPRYRLVDSEAGRSHYVYVLEICHAGRVHKVEKRYSAFHSLYKQIRKHYPNSESEFPPKRIRNTTGKVLEARRAGLETWLSSAILIEPTPPQLLAFLQIHNYQPPSSSEGSGSSSDDSPAHQPLLLFTRDPFILNHNLQTPTLTNQVSKGVLTALYDQSFIMPV